MTFLRIRRDVYEWIDVRFYETIINTGEVIDTMWRTLGGGGDIVQRWRQDT